MRNALTFDVEDYFHVETFREIVAAEDWERFAPRVVDNTRRILDLLDARGARATFFVLGWVAERWPALVRDIQARGHELGCHSHRHRMVTRMDVPSFREDVRRAKASIEDAAGVAVEGFRAPTFSIVRSTWWALGVLAEEGFVYDSSVFPIRHDRYGIPDAPRFPHRVPLEGGGSIVEFPMTTVAMAGQHLPFSGGGYFRLLPYGLIRAGVRQVNRRDGMPAMVYLHPWEFDPAQPRLPVRGLNRFRQYVNLATTRPKLERLLEHFAFAPARDVLAERGLLPVAA
ncbi:MAG TPA: XrtA system polysaccharide deacetylase [Candidatus Tectomicrobia bacterium]|nr:XrtA system polysaccharide deacetylase [Candidatus Tectomicrobia bacterium]